MRVPLLVVLFLVTVGPAKAGEVICGEDWISFEPLEAAPFSRKPGANTYLVRKSDIRRASQPRGHSSDVGYVILTPIEGDARKDGEYRVTREAYLAMRACLLGRP